MAPPRRKAARQDAPQTAEEATEMLGRYMRNLTLIEAFKADADRMIQMIEHQRDALIEPIETEAKDFFKQLRAWWAVAKGEMTGGKRKSIPLAGALIGERMTSPSLKLPTGMKVEDFVKALEDGLGEEAEQFLRRTVKPDKPSIIKRLRGEDPLAERISTIGASVSQRVEFFIDRDARPDADPEMVDTGDEED